MTPLDLDRMLALAYVPAARREAVRTLWQLDAHLGSVLAGGRERMLSQIKLAWWREALEKLDGAAPPAEPLLEAVAANLLTSGISGAELGELEQGWVVLVQEEALEPEDLETYAAGRGATLFRLTARVLGAEVRPEHLHAGEAWALVDLARNSGEPDASAALAAAKGKAGESIWPARLRPLGMLAILAARDTQRTVVNFEPQGAPRRMLRMLRHRMTGR